MRPARRRFDDLEQAERQQAKGRGCKQRRTESLMVHGAQHSGEARGLARVGIISGKAKKADDQEKNHGTRERPERIARPRGCAMTHAVHCRADSSSLA